LASACAIKSALKHSETFPAILGAELGQFPETIDQTLDRTALCVVTVSGNFR